MCYAGPRSEVRGTLIHLTNATEMIRARQECLDHADQFPASPVAAAALAMTSCGTR
jgi:hypothetical protein